MRLLLAALAVAAGSAPIPPAAVRAIDGRVAFRNYLPARVPAGFAYRGWSYRGGVLRVEFRSGSGPPLEWRVEPMHGACDAGAERSFQLGGNKVWWARRARRQRAWRCVFDLAGKPLRLVAASAAPPARLAPAGLGAVAAHAGRR
ncbi:MAG TPA: hypothetical protein VFB42_12735 [Gaiellaceae bacterium]|nr:hypothetical protein [Gaiellaceae bacterium]